MVEEGLGDVVGEAREDEQRRLLQVGRVGGGGGLEEEGQQLGPGVLGEEERGAVPGWRRQEVCVGRRLQAAGSLGEARVSDERGRR